MQENRKTAQRKPKIVLAVAGLAATLLALVAAACGGAAPTATPTQAGQQPSPAATPTGTTGTIRLNGAGATFPFPLYTRWFDEYAKVSNTRVNYQSIGSGGGIRQITEGTVDFGASDGIMTDQQEAAAEQRGGPILHIPMTLGAVAVVYNLSGIGPGQLKLTPDVLADIYLKKITRWNDP